MSSTASPTPSKLPESLLTPEQHEAIDRLYETDETLLIAGVGFGKAVVGLTAIQQLLHDSVLRRVLVVAPLRVCQLTWATERHKWEHIYPDGIAIACGDAKVRAAAMESGCSVVVVNFENLVWAVDNYGHLFDGLLIDEITKLKTVSGVGAKKLRFWVRGLKWRAGMSANPVAETGQDVYAQALLLDLGKALGTRKETFLHRFYYPVDFNRRKWQPLPGTQAAVAELLGDLVYYADDAKYKEDLPPVVDLVDWVDLPAAGWDLYDAITNTGLVKVGNVTALAPNAGQVSLKQYQIAAGGLYGGEDEERDLLWFDPYKVEWALARAEEVDTPVVIVYEFKFQIDELRRRDPRALVLGQGSRFTELELAAWSRGRHKHLFMHQKSAAHGLNLQYGSHTLLCMAPTWGSDPWQQILGRLRRRGQPADHVDRWTAMARGTVDEKAWGGLGVKGEFEALQMAAFKK